MPTDAHSVVKSVPAPSLIDRLPGARSRLSASYLELIAAEGEASRILHFHPVVVPGLLQTREYATALTVATILHPTTNDEIETQVETRMQRQRDILYGSRPIQLTFILEEISILRPVGSAMTMHAQLDHLIQVMDHPAVTLVVLPPGFPPHPGITGSFMLIRGIETRSEDVLCLEGAMGNTVIRGRPDLKIAYRRLAERLIASGRSGAIAKQAIRSLRAQVR